MRFPVEAPSPYASRRYTPDIAGNDSMQMTNMKHEECNARSSFRDEYADDLGERQRNYILTDNFNKRLCTINFEVASSTDAFKGGSNRGRNAWPSYRRSNSEESPRTPLIETPYPMMVQSSMPLPPRFSDSSPRLAAYVPGRLFGRDGGIRGSFLPSSPFAAKRTDTDIPLFPQEPSVFTAPKRKQSLAPKTPFMLLHEKFPSITSSMKPRFRCTAEISGETFVGEARSKKLAKQIMAHRAVEKLIPETE
ncbi:unnamed protein product, partial [Soboliphyme baturini]|uniref:DRBM domain-containing protein n=1 Tax=Soboliphyme baturini TaxID=241478 RepID=A0A183J9K4_9BILA